MQLLITQFYYTIIYNLIIYSSFLFFSFYLLTIFIIIHTIVLLSNITQHERLNFIKIYKNFYAATGFYDYRFNYIRILVGASKDFNSSLVIRIDKIMNSSYKRVVYDECSEYDKDFDLKYTNLIIYYYKAPHIITINNAKISIYSPKYNEKYFLAVCITAMYNFNAKLMLQQLIETYLELGINHFTLYYTSSSEDVKSILAKYVKINMLRVIYWERNNNTIRMRNYGQYIKTNDCLYRYMHISKYIINTDLDEIIIPLKHKNLISLVYSFNKHYPNKTVFIFSSKMFIKNETVDTDVKKKKADYINQHRIIDANIYKITKCCYSDRFYKKYIVKTNEMIALQIHYAWKGNIDVYNVPYRVGYSRHTRRVANFMRKYYCNTIENDKNLSIILPHLYQKYSIYI